MTRRLHSAAAIGAFASALAGVAGAQTGGYVPGVAECNTTNCGYVLSFAATPGNNVVRSAVYNGTKGISGNLCYRTLYWTPSMAIAGCDPDLVPKAAAAAPTPAPAARPAPAPAPAPAATPARPAPAPAAAGVQKITLASKALFDFDKAVLKPEGKAAIDSEIISKLPGVQKLELVLVTGHTDRIGTQAYNQKLSERRADAVRDYLVSKGVAKDKIETLGMGKTQPLPGVSCSQTAMKELIACLAPNRRVEVEVKGEAVKR
ncbi:Outer membrane protein A [Gammaproteobacteria bacterium]|nr:Outer membrane protein A [Gammaproteobacteria bacterium]